MVAIGRNCKVRPGPIAAMSSRDDPRISFHAHHRIGKRVCSRIIVLIVSCECPAQTRKASTAVSWPADGLRLVIDCKLQPIRMQAPRDISLASLTMIRKTPARKTP